MAKDPWFSEFRGACSWCHCPWAEMKLVVNHNGSWIGVYCLRCGGPHRLPVVGGRKDDQI